MEEEFHGGVCGGNRWNPSRFGSSPCHSAGNWLHHGGVIVGVKTATSISDDSAGSTSDGGSSVVLQDGNMSVASTLQMMGTSRSSSSPTDYWNLDLIHDNGRSHENYSPILQALDPSMNCRQKTADNWNGDSSKQLNPGFPQEQQQPNSFTNFPLNPASYSYTSSVLQTLFDTDSPATATSFSSSPNYPMSSSQILPRQQPGNNHQFANNAPFWTAAAAATGDVRASFLHSAQPQLIPSSLSKAKLNPQNVTAKRRNENAGDTDTACKKVSNEGALKRPRIETPSPLPTFKVRKEKLGDRVTALQQLVSPFGKTDTASVLHEAIEYIKLLHDQVGVLSTPYLKIGVPPLQRPQPQALDKIKDQEEPMKDLRSRGLCLVPISSTFPVAAETTTDFWTPTFGGSFG